MRADSSRTFRVSLDASPVAWLIVGTVTFGAKHTEDNEQEARTMHLKINLLWHYFGSSG